MAAISETKVMALPNTDEEGRIPDLEAFLIQNVTFSGKKLGDGSYGSVEEAEILGAVCAVKRIHDLYLQIGSAEDIRCMRNAFVNECRLMSSVCHPHLVQFLGICYTPGSKLPALVMERLETSLHKKLESEKNIHLDTKISILVDVARGLAYLHGHSPPIIHRDLTARNILITTSGVAKITDFGMAKILNLRPGQGAGTMTKGPGNAFYMPPEATEDHAKYSTPIDIFSFGHAALFTGTQKFPDLKSATYVDPKTRLVSARTEVDRREDSFVLLSKSIGKDHPCIALVKQCLHNIPEERPTAVRLLKALEDIRPRPDMKQGDDRTASARVKRGTEVAKVKSYSSEQRRKKYQVKVVVHGNNGSGVTSVLNRVVDNSFRPDTNVTLGANFAFVRTVVDGNPIKAVVWDTAGHESFFEIIKLYFKGTDAVMLVYDITSHDSFEEVTRRYEHMPSNICPDAVCMLVGNKCDLAHSRQVPETEGKKYAEENNMLFYETSALDSTNVNKAFTELITEAYKKKCDTASKNDLADDKLQNLDEEERTSSRGCFIS